MFYVLDTFSVPCVYKKYAYINVAAVVCVCLKFIK